MFDPLRFAKKLDDQLVGRAVGYQYAIYAGEKLSASGAGGYAVLSPQTPLANTLMTPDRRMTVVSMSKTITATAFMRALEILNAAGANLSIDSKIAPYLPLAWKHGPHVDEITFKQLLTHTSALCSVGDEDLFDSLKQTIAAGATKENWEAHCCKPDCYQNCNFSLLRILIPNMLYGVGVSADQLPGGDNPGHYTARLYFNFVRDQVLGPVGLSDVSLVANGSAEEIKYYDFHNPSTPYADYLFDWYLLRVGAGHWFMSAKEYARFIAGLRNGKIVSAASFKQMTDHNLGMYRAAGTTGGLNWNHNGAFTINGAGAEGDWMILPNGFTSVCFVNSQGGHKKSLYEMIRNAFNAAWLSPATTATAPAATALGNRLYIAIKGDDNNLYLNHAVDGQPCAGWMEVEGYGSTTLAPATAAFGNRIYVFIRGINDQQIYVNSALVGQPFDGFGFGWSAIPNATTDATPAAATLGNRIYVFAKGINDKQIYVNSALDGQAFDGWGNGWSAIPGITTNTAPAAASLDNRLYVFAKSLTDNRLYVNSALNGQAFDGWGNGWSVIPGLTTDTSPAAAVLGNRIYVFAKGLNNRIYVNSALAGQAMGNWKEVEGNRSTDTAVGATALGGRMYIFAKGINDKRIYVNSALNGQAFDGWGNGWSEVQW